MESTYKNIQKSYLQEVIVEVTPMNDIGKGINHTGLLLKLKNGKRVILEHGKKYFKKQKVVNDPNTFQPPEETEVIVSEFDAAHQQKWEESADPIQPKNRVTLKEVVNVGAQNGSYNFVLNNCITAKENILEYMGIPSEYGQKAWEVAAKCGKPPLEIQNGLAIRTATTGTGIIAVRVAEKAAIQAAEAAAAKGIQTAATTGVLTKIASPVFLIGDGAELVTRVGVTALGGGKVAEEVTGSVVGLGSYVGIGAVLGGPVGAGIGAGVYGGTRLVGLAVDGIIGLFKKKNTPIV